MCRPFCCPAHLVRRGGRRTPRPQGQLSCQRSRLLRVSQVREVSNGAESRIHAVLGDKEPLDAKDPDALSLGLTDEFVSRIDLDERLATAAHDSIGTAERPRRARLSQPHSAEPSGRYGAVIRRRSALPGHAEVRTRQTRPTEKRPQRPGSHELRSAEESTALPIASGDRSDSSRDRSNIG